MRHFAFGVLCCLLVFAGGCAPKTTLSYMPSSTLYERGNTAVYEAGIDKTWNAAIKSIGENFFVLDNIEKESRIITLSFSVDNPAQYIDCGRTSVHTVNAGNQNANLTYEVAAKSVRYPHVLQPGMMPVEVLRTSNLEGKANIIFVEEGKGKTRVTVNTRYVYTSTRTGVETVFIGWTAFNQPFSQTSSPVIFNTGQTGMSESVQCVTKYALEKSILNDIRTKLNNQ